MNIQLVALLSFVVLTHGVSAAAQSQTIAVKETNRHNKCAVAMPPPARLSGWTTHFEKPGMKHSRELLRADVANMVPLMHAQNVSYPVAPRISNPKLYGGVFSINVQSADTYGIAIEAKSWVDLIQGDQIVASTAWEPGPKCAGIHKIVYFNLTPGTYTVEISNSIKPQERMLLVMGGPFKARHKK